MRVFPFTLTLVRKPDELLVPDTVFFASEDKPCPEQSKPEEKTETVEEQSRYSRQRCNSDSVLKATNPDEILRSHEQLCIRRAEAVKKRGISLLNEVDAQYSALQVVYLWHRAFLKKYLLCQNVWCKSCFFFCSVWKLKKDFPKICLFSRWNTMSCYSDASKPQTSSATKLSRHPAVPLPAAAPAAACPALQLCLICPCFLKTASSRSTRLSSRRSSPASKRPKRTSAETNNRSGTMNPPTECYSSQYDLLSVTLFRGCRCCKCFQALKVLDMPVASLSKIKWQKVARCIIFVVRNIYSWINEQKAHFHMQTDLNPKVLRPPAIVFSFFFFVMAAPWPLGPLVFGRERHM